MSIPDKRYFTIGEVSTFCALKPHVLRYWEQEFDALRPNKRRGNRRYYRREDVLLVQQIKHLLYEKGFTITGARAQLVAMAALPPEPVVAAAAAQPVVHIQTPSRAGSAFSLAEKQAIRALLEEARDMLV